MLNKCLILINQLADIKSYQEAGFTAFLFALKDFSVGYPQTYTPIELATITSDKYLLINRLLDSESVAELRLVLKDLPNIKGLVYEDIAVYQLVKALNLNLALIYFPNHGLCNQQAVAYWLNKGLTSIILANELTLAEITAITNAFPGQVTVPILGYNQTLYSRRQLLTNYEKRFKLAKKSMVTIREPITGHSFNVVENEWGTVLYHNPLSFSQELLANQNIKYYFINSLFIKPQTIIALINNEPVNVCYDSSFLNQPTIYKLPKEEAHE